ncbi:MAG: imidazole glycerol phosphate synthase subunit HisH [Lachnospiraceae bacterium]|nr:imidazole glycerol phosphate synthase subunit HisH [Lachnospiraceae bacterium]
MVAIIDYGVGNLFSLKSSFASLGIPAEATADPERILAADRLILPGVGAFEDAAKKLRESGLSDLVKEEAASGKPLLGICLGMQLLLDKSYEYGEHQGLSLIPGKVTAMRGRIPSDLKVPAMGWNALHFVKESPLFRYIHEGDCVYFVHSYSAVDCDAYISATVEYGTEITASIERDNVFGCQFHPEKSGDVGLRILRAFADL